MKTTRLEGLFTWNVYQPDREIDFNGFLWTRPDGNLLIDPMEVDGNGKAFLDSKGGVSWILLTNFDHLRAAPSLAQASGARILAPAGERERFGPQAEAVDAWYETADDLPGPLREDVEVFFLRGGKSPVEAALYLRPLRALVFGDLVRSHVCGKLQLLPPAKIADPARVAESLRPLRDLDVDAVLLGDGDSFYAHGREALHELLDSLE